MGKYREHFFKDFQDENVNPETRYELAHKRVKKIKAFYVHALVFVLVNAFIIVSKYDKAVLGSGVSFVETFSTALFWGIGLLGHGLTVFGRDIFFSADWEERKIKEFMDKDKSQKWR